MKITICGSITFGKEMMAAAEALQARGAVVETPDMSERDISRFSAEQKVAYKNQLIRQHLEKINRSDAVLIYNLDKNGIANYIGGCTLMEIGFAFAAGLKIFLLNPIPACGYSDEIEGVLPVVLNGDIEACLIE